MSKVTSKLQVTIPKKLAQTHGIEPGGTIHFESAGDSIRIRVPHGSEHGEALDRDLLLQMFDEATGRQEARNKRLTEKGAESPEPGERGWTREELYDRGLPR